MNSTEAITCAGLRLALHAAVEQGALERAEVLRISEVLQDACVSWDLQQGDGYEAPSRLDRDRLGRLGLLANVFEQAGGVR